MWLKKAVPSIIASGVKPLASLVFLYQGKSWMH
nr:MAG TPA: hypothetical protein [Caudoviricetes sp.]